MKRAVRVSIIVLLVATAAWWLFWQTPSRGGRRGDTIRFGFWGDYQEYRMWVAVVEEFNRRHPDIRVGMEYIPGGGEYARKMTAWQASDSMPEVVLVQDEPFPGYIDTRDGATPVMLDLTTLLAGEAADEPNGALDANDYWPGAWELFGRRDEQGWRQYALPVFGGNNLIFYNRDCFRRAGLPLPEQTRLDEHWTIEEFTDLCRRLTIRQEQDGQVRTVQWGFDLPYGWIYWLPFIYACDADILSDDRTEFVFAGPEALASLRLWRTLQEERLVPLGGDLGQMGQNVAFLTGRVAMMSQGPWLMPFLNEAKVDYGVLMPPRGPGGGRGTRVTWDGIALSGRLREDPAKAAQAFTFAAFVASEPAGRIFARAQRSIPARRSARQTMIAADPGGRAEKFIDALAFSRPQPITLQWAQMDNALTNAMNKMITGRATPEATLETMADAMVKRRLFPVGRPDGSPRPMEDRP